MDVFAGFEFVGTWWLPEDPAQLLPGRLRFAPGAGLLLELQGAWDVDRPLILGDTSVGRPVTLFECFQKESRMSIPGGATSVYRANWALVGAHCAREEDARFRGIEGEFKHLGPWVRRSGFDSSSGQGSRPYSIVYEPLAAQTFSVAMPNRDTRATVELTWRPTISHALHQASIDERIRLAVTVEADPLGFADLNALLYDAALLTAVGAGVGLDPLLLILREKANQQESQLPPEEVSLVFSPAGDPRDHSYVGELFSYSDVAGNLGPIIGHWLTFVDEHRHLMNLYKAVLNRQVDTPDVSCLVLTFALEGLHRALCSGDVLPRAEHRQRVKAVVSHAPDPLKGWTCEKLGQANMKSLRQALSELGGRLPGIANILGWSDELQKRIADTRNSFSHALAPSAHRLVLEGRPLLDAVARMRLMFEAQVLYEVGFAEADVGRFVARCVATRCQSDPGGGV